MPVIEGGSSGALAGVGAQAAVGMHVIRKPVDVGALGHYQVNHRCALLLAQAANSRIFEVRNNHGTNLHVPMFLELQWLQTGAHTAAIEDSLDVFKCTAFSAVDTVNTVTPTASRKRSSMATAPGGCDIRGLTVAGVAAGMTGGTLTKDGGAIGQLPHWLLAVVPTAGTHLATARLRFQCGEADEHPFVFIQNEGFIVENRVLLGAAAGSSVYINYAWAEVTAY